MGAKGLKSIKNADLYSPIAKEKNLNQGKSGKYGKSGKKTKGEADDSESEGATSQFG
jgi:hypothetical protein